MEDRERETWHAVWRARLDRSLPNGCKLALADYFAGQIKATIAADPPEYAHRVYRKSDICPVCGASTRNEPRIGASLDIEGNPDRYQAPLMVGVWVHANCLETCPVIGPAAHIPW